MGVSTAEQEWLAAAVGGRVREFYAEIGVDLPDSAGSEAPVRCFANPAAHKHEDRNKSCGVNTLTGLWKCHGCGLSGNAYQAAVFRGYRERDAALLAQRHGLFLEGAKEKSESFSMGGAKQWVRWMDALYARPSIVARLSELKGWTPEAVHRCGLGWDGERLPFVIRRPQGHGWKIVGVARYLPGGEPKMIALPGSERNLFPPPELMVGDRPLFMVEGEPDAVSVRSAGRQAVAVPGAHSWKREWAQRFGKFRRVIVLCDCDAKGRDLAGQVKQSLPRAEVVDLDASRDDGWDVGDLVAECSREGGLWQATRVLDGLV